MKKNFLLNIAMVLFGMGGNAQSFIEVESPNDAAKTIEALRKGIVDKGFHIFTEIDHSEAAEKVGMKLDTVHILIFGNPEVGTKLMQADPRVGIELPIKILVWKSDGQTMVGYKNPETQLKEYRLGSSRGTVEKLANVLSEIVGEATQNKG